MAEPPSPAPAAPAPGALVAVRDRREEVIALLTAEFARDTFDVDELERRLDLVHRAESVAALDALVVDLVPAGGAASTALAPRPAATAVVPEGWPKRRRQLAIFGGFEKKGPWTCAQHLRVVAVFGGGSLDFRDAEMAPGVTELHITAIMGGLEVIVPPSLAVECDASAIMGGFEQMHRAPRSPDPGRPVLRITGLAVMGGVSIETRLPGETGRDARKRARREEKALRRASRQLPEATARLPPGRDRE